MTVMRRRQFGFMGHVLRGISLEKSCLLGLMYGRKERERQRKKYMYEIKELIRCERRSEFLD